MRWLASARGNSGASAEEAAGQRRRIARAQDVRRRSGRAYSNPINRVGHNPENREKSSSAPGMFCQPTGKNPSQDGKAEPAQREAFDSCRDAHGYKCRERADRRGENGINLVGNSRSRSLEHAGCAMLQVIRSHPFERARGHKRHGGDYRPAGLWPPGGPAISQDTRTGPP